MLTEKLTIEIAPRPNMEYFLSRDNSGHWILVPQPIRAWWFKYLEIPDDDERSLVYPEGCIEVNGGPESVVFSNFRAAKTLDTEGSGDILPA